VLVRALRGTAAREAANSSCSSAIQRPGSGIDSGAAFFPRLVATPSYTVPALCSAARSETGISMNQQVRETVKSPATIQANLLSVLSNEIRVEVLTQLARSGQNVSEIAAELQLDPSTVSHALQKLQGANLVELAIHKKEHFYRLSSAVNARVDGAFIQIEVITDTVKVSIKSPIRGSLPGR